ncbi:hypothetical protein Q0590_07560 [Rhodocytophaga aerolata]|uniref:Uncharacterized protein n=1 Tax=Rhodocytophaga aerolata TaxID=455078 RepID=A0ABT8R1Y9_9BACT|nr:hypothetical protein [Rhodocytophaga aerolata]MDO1446102.1 hypothetical protein [Rhodocytophaga aerolata]
MHLIKRQRLEKFREFTAKEPRLQDLYLQIINLTNKDIDEYGLITRMWLEKFKPQMIQLVGQQRTHKDELSTNEAYKLVYDTLFNALPYGNIYEEEYDDEYEEDVEFKTWYVHYLNY